jgi:hypothetical protein
MSRFKAALVGALVAAGTCATSARADSGGVTLTISAAVGGGAFMVVTKPDLNFKCRQSGVVMTCVAHSRPIQSVEVRAQLVTDNSGDGPPVRDRQWQGDCAGSRGVVCTLDLTKSRVVKIALH